MLATKLDAWSHRNLWRGFRYPQPPTTRALPCISLLMACCCLDATLAAPLAEPKRGKQASDIMVSSDRMHHLVGALRLLGDAAEKVAKAPTDPNSQVVMSRLPQQLKAASNAAKTLETEALMRAEELQEAKALESKQALEISEQRNELVELKTEMVRQAEGTAKMEQHAKLEKEKLEDALRGISATKLELLAEERAVEKSSQLAIQKIRNDADEKISSAEAETLQAQKKLDQVKIEARQELSFQATRKLKSLFRFIGTFPEETHAQATSIAPDPSTGDTDTSLQDLLAAQRDIGLATEYARSQDRMLDIEPRYSSSKHVVSNDGLLERQSFRRLRNYLSPSPPQHNREIRTQQQDLSVKSLRNHGVAEGHVNVAKNEKDDTDPAFSPLLRAQAALSGLKLH